MNQLTQDESEDQAWRGLYTAGGAAAAVMAVFVPIQIIVFILWPPPNTVVEWFGLFQRSKLVGLLDLDLLLIADIVLMIPLYLALYVALRRINQSAMAVGLALALVSVVAYLASNGAFAMLGLSDGYAAAGTDAQRAMYLAAGQAILTNNSQSTAFHAYYVLGSAAPIIMSIVMLRSATFSKAIAYLGIVGNVIAFGLCVPTMGIYISLFSVLFLWVWYILLARRLLRLGRSTAGATGQASASGLTRDSVPT